MLAALGVAVLTVVVYFIRADQAGAGNWPVNFELGNSDNGVLFQFAQDVFLHRPLNWVFSPQVFIFPEMPISLVAYLLGGGSVQAYYFLVAAINNVLLFAAFFAVIRKLFPNDPFPVRLARTALTSLPLVFLPLVTQVSVYDFALAPTYYVGIYLVIITGPLLYVTRRRTARLTLAAAIALTIASNPLGLVFTAPVLVVVAGVRIISARRAENSALVLTAGTLVAAGVIRFALFTPLEGISALTYIDPSAVADRQATLALTWQQIVSSGVDTGLFVVAALCAVVAFGGGLVALARILRSRSIPDSADLGHAILIYFRLVPVLGLSVCLILLILNSHYLWPILVGPLLFALFELPTKYLRPAVFGGSGLFVACAVIIAATTTATLPGQYLSYRSPETRCLDSRLPAGMTTGYADYLDARRLELTSDRGLRLIQLSDDGTQPYYWLTNRDYFAATGTFFYVDADTGQRTLSGANIIHQIGTPDESISCGGSARILVYTDDAKLTRIAALFTRKNTASD